MKPEHDIKAVYVAKHAAMTIMTQVPYGVDPFEFFEKVVIYSREIYPTYADARAKQHEKLRATDTERSVQGVVEPTVQREAPDRQEETGADDKRIPRYGSDRFPL